MAKRGILKNTMGSIVPKLGNLVIGFVTRKLIINLIAVEYLGLTSLYANLLDLLNLAELGIGVAIQIRMYSPLVNGENDKISNLIQMTRKVYNTIGKAVAVVGLLSVFLLRFIVKDNPFPMWYVSVAYLFSVAGITLSFFCASKRLYFESNEKYYFLSISDMFAKLLAYVVGFIVLYFTREYLYYAAIVAFYGFLSNVFLTLVFKKKYGKLYDYPVDLEFQKSELATVKKNLKDVVPMRLSVFVFTSTDSIVISSFLGLTLVAIYSNYYLIFFNLLSISAIASTALVSTFGKMEKELGDKGELLKRYKVYETSQFMFSSFSTVAVFLLVDKFMALWMGPDLLMERICVVFLSLDYYIHSYFQPLSTLYTSTGKFKQDKICSISAAILNIVLSVVLVNFIGLLGIILGTFISNFFTFIVRTTIINGTYFKRGVLDIILTPTLHLIVCVIECAVCYWLISLLSIQNLYLDFIVSAFICLIVPNVVNVLIALKKGYHKLILKKA